MPANNSSCTVAAPGNWAKGLAILLQSQTYSLDLDFDPWQFAVELPFLQKAGLSCGDLRWLIFQGYVEHGHEVSTDDSPQREFRSIGSATFRPRSCFRLTDAGVQFAKQELWDKAVSFRGTIAAAEVHSPQNPVAAPQLEVRTTYEHLQDGGPNGVVPIWNGERHQLRVQQHLVKEFKVPSANQEAILTAFEEEGWPDRIDDPLPPVGHIDPKRRLHDAIKGLNRNQKTTLLRFRGDGTGEGVQWDIITRNESESDT